MVASTLLVCCSMVARRASFFQSCWPSSRQVLKNLVSKARNCEWLHICGSASHSSCSWDDGTWIKTQGLANLSITLPHLLLLLTPFPFVWLYRTVLGSISDVRDALQAHDDGGNDGALVDELNQFKPLVQDAQTRQDNTDFSSFQVWACRCHTNAQNSSKHSHTCYGVTSVWVHTALHLHRCTQQMHARVPLTSSQHFHTRQGTFVWACCTCTDVDRHPYADVAIGLILACSWIT